jgi:hypothetical protein
VKILLMQSMTNRCSGPFAPPVLCGVMACGSLLVLLFLGGCTRHPPPPPHQSFGGLPVSGSLADALRGGFTRCIEDTITMRCRRQRVMLEGQGPYEAAVDLVGSDGSGGFNQLTLWHSRDQSAVLAVGRALERQGWSYCLTGNDTRGDYQIYRRRGSPVRIAIDISYWGKRRLRVIPEWLRSKPLC